MPRDGSSQAVTSLADLDLTRMQSHCWQHIAQAQAKLFEQYIRQALARGG
jgi:hypothetical protein